MIKKYSLLISLSSLFVCLGFSVTPTLAGQTMTFDNFMTDPAARWEFITDQVMGGVSSGKLEFKTDTTNRFARMTGNVSLENKGGFIQFRRKVNKKFDNSLMYYQKNL